MLYFLFLYFWLFFFLFLFFFFSFFFSFFFFFTARGKIIPSQDLTSRQGCGACVVGERRPQAIWNAACRLSKPTGVGMGLRNKTKRARVLVFFKVVLGADVFGLVISLEQTICIVLIIIHKVWPEVPSHCFQTSNIFLKVGGHCRYPKGCIRGSKTI